MLLNRDVIAYRPCAMVRQKVSVEDYLLHLLV